ncbi:MAG: FecR domain-containing protein [Treponema sp.]|nr:FecR domain-containing protein [Treponema sp.]
MKKLIFSLIFGFATFSSFAFQATVVSAKGKAEVQSGSEWVAIKTGDTLDQGAVIQTGFKSEVVLKLKESTVTVAPLTRITLQTLAERNGVAGAPGKDETSIFLDTGSLKSNVQKSQDRRVGFTVRSPVATASVRGTEFRLGTKFRGVKLSTKNGKVAFWKNTVKSEAVLDGASANPEAPAEEAGTGDSAQDISDYAPQGAIVVSKGENAEAQTNQHSATPPAAVARGNAASLGGGTQTASSAEIAAHSANAPVAVAATEQSTAKKIASLSVLVEFEDAE